jgi:hypothetical protein
MIEFIDLNREQPYKIFLNKYQQALEKKQKNIEAIAISSFNPKTDEVESRFVNLKYIKDDQWIFFSNYNSNKTLLDIIKSQDYFFGIKQIRKFELKLLFKKRNQVFLIGIFQSAQRRKMLWQLVLNNLKKLILLRVLGEVMRKSSKMKSYYIRDPIIGEAIHLYPIILSFGKGKNFD